MMPTVSALIVVALVATTAVAQPSPEAWVVFTSSRSGEGDLYAVHPATGETVLVVGTSAPEGAARYDAARGRVVYHRFDEERALLVADGETLFEDPNGDVAPAWSPAGDVVVYADERDGQEDLFRARPDGTGEERLTDDAFIDRYPAWSPSGDAVVFARRLETGWDLHALYFEGDTTRLERLTEERVYVGHPAWSPDGRLIAFDTLIDEQTEIALLEVATGEITRLTDRPGNDLVPTWSPDGRFIAFGGQPGNNWDVWLVDVETQVLTRLTTDEAYDGGPVFVPASALGN